MITSRVINGRRVFSVQPRSPSGEASSGNAGGLFDTANNVITGLFSDPLGTAERVAAIRNTFRSGDSDNGGTGETGGGDTGGENFYDKLIARLTTPEQRQNLNEAYARQSLSDYGNSVATFGRNNTAAIVAAIGVAAGVLYFAKGRRR